MCFERRKGLVRGAHAVARLVERPPARRIGAGTHAERVAVLDRERDLDELQVLCLEDGPVRLALAGPRGAVARG